MTEKTKLSMKQKLNFLFVKFEIAKLTRKTLNINTNSCTNLTTFCDGRSALLNKTPHKDKNIE